MGPHGDCLNDEVPLERSQPAEYGSLKGDDLSSRAYASAHDRAIAREVTMVGNFVPPGSGRAMAPGYKVKLENGAGGDIAVFEAEHPPGAPGPPRHMHRSYDEGFYVLNGTMSFSVDNDRFESPAGSFVWIPRGAAHSFHNTSERPATLLVIVTAEAITLVEEFLTLARNGPPEPDEARALLAQYDTVLA